MIIGIGIDIVDLRRFGDSLQRAGVKERLFSPAELTAAPEPRQVEYLAGRFAAKEALAKALASPGGLVWTDAEIMVSIAGQPSFVLVGTVKTRAELLGVTSTHLSITHDAGIAAAVVVLEA